MIALALVMAQVVSQQPYIDRIYALMHMELETVQTARDLDRLSATFHQQVDDLAKYGAPISTSVGKTFDRIVAKERICRADARCMEERAFIHDVLQPMCNAVETIQSMEQDIKDEKSNPSGVVNLARLHQDGENIQTMQLQFDELEPKYEAFRHKPWDGEASECK